MGFQKDEATDSPTPYTRKYAALEVIRHEKRGFSAGKLV